MSFGSPLNFSMQGTSNLLEADQLSSIMHRILPSLQRNSEQAADIFRGTWPTMTACHFATLPPYMGLSHYHSLSHRVVLHESLDSKHDMMPPLERMRSSQL